MAVADCTRECRYCGKSFEVTRKDRVYCSRRCGIYQNKGIKNPGVGRGRYPGSGSYDRSHIKRAVVPCSVDGCEGRSKSLGLCVKHYQRLRAHGDPSVTLRGRRIERACGWCGQAMSLKPASDQKYCSRSCCALGVAAAAGKAVGGTHCVCAGCGLEFRKKLSSKNAGKYCTRECDFRSRRRVAAEVRSLRRIAENIREGRHHAAVNAEAISLKRIASNWRKGWSAQVRRLRKCTECHGLFAQKTHWGQPEIRCAKCKPAWESVVSQRSRKSPAARAAKARRKAIMRGVDRHADRIDPVAVFERDGWRCHICKGKTPKRLRGTYEPNAPELDHIIPIAANGSHTWGNVACACRRCNGLKSDKPLGQLGLGFAA